MAFPILGSPRPQFVDSSGSPYASGTLAVLDPADDTNKASYPTYDDAEAASNANDNPITLDARGSCSLWGLDNEDYKLVLKDVNAATVWTSDDVFLPTLLPKKYSTTFTSTDATPSISGNTHFILAGTTTITDFDDGVIGNTINIRAAGGTQSLVIQNGAPILLAGGVDFRMANNDSLTLAMFSDQVWTEIGRTNSKAGPKFLTADVSLINVTLADVSDLSTWTLPPATYYAVDGYLKTTSDGSTQDIKFALQTDNAFQEDHWMFSNTNEDGTHTSAGGYTDAGVTTTAMTADLVSAKVHGIIIRGFFLTHASASRSVVDFQAAQGTDAGTTTLEKGSWLNICPFD